MKRTLVYTADRGKVITQENLKDILREANMVHRLWWAPVVVTLEAGSGLTGRVKKIKLEN